MASYIPARDGVFDVWAQNFQAVVAASPATYGLQAADATSITAAYNTWHAAYLLVANPGTKTSATVAAKDVAKASSLITLRTYAQIIQKNVAVSNGAKSAAGLTVPATGRTPIPAPATTPILGFIAATPGVLTLKFSDTATPTTKAKPFGAIQIELWAQIAPTGTPNVASAAYQGAYTKSPLQWMDPGANAGKAVVMWARWITRRGLVGPWSAPLSATIV